MDKEMYVVTKIITRDDIVDGPVESRVFTFDNWKDSFGKKKELFDKEMEAIREAGFVTVKASDENENFAYIVVKDKTANQFVYRILINVEVFYNKNVSDGNETYVMSKFSYNDSNINEADRDIMSFDSYKKAAEAKNEIFGKAFKNVYDRGFTQIQCYNEPDSNFSQLISSNLRKEDGDDSMDRIVMSVNKVPFAE